jgi:hypothetical protein
MTKYKLKALYNEISSKLKTSKNKLKIMETNLEFLKSKNYDSHMNVYVPSSHLILSQTFRFFQLKNKYFED